MKLLMVTREEAPVLMITKNLLLITFLLIRLTRQPWQGKHPSQVKIWWLLRVSWGWSEVVGMLRWGIVKVPQILIFAVCQYNGYFYIVKYYCLPSLYNSEDNVSLVCIQHKSKPYERDLNVIWIFLTVQSVPYRGLHSLFAKSIQRIYFSSSSCVFQSSPRWVWRKIFLDKN